MWQTIARRGAIKSEAGRLLTWRLGMTMDLLCLVVVGAIKAKVDGGGAVCQFGFAVDSGMIGGEWLIWSFCFVVRQ